MQKAAMSEKRTLPFTTEIIAIKAENREFIKIRFKK